MTVDSSPSITNPCRCVGPLYGEPFCDCVMRNDNLPRSKEFLEAKAQSRELLPELNVPIFSPTKHWKPARA